MYVSYFWLITTKPRWPCSGHEQSLVTVCVVPVGIIIILCPLWEVLLSTCLSRFSWKLSYVRGHMHVCYVGNQIMQNCYFQSGSHIYIFTNKLLLSRNMHLRLPKTYSGTTLLFAVVGILFVIHYTLDSVFMGLSMRDPGLSKYMYPSFCFCIQEISGDLAPSFDALRLQYIFRIRCTCELGKRFVVHP